MFLISLNNLLFGTFYFGSSCIFYLFFFYSKKTKIRESERERDREVKDPFINVTIATILLWPGIRRVKNITEGNAVTLNKCFIWNLAFSVYFM